MNVAHEPGVSPDPIVGTDSEGETNKIISKLDFMLFCVLITSLVCLLIFYFFVFFPFSAAWLGLFQVTRWMVPM